jgi:hypothetical protein
MTINFKLMTLNFLGYDGDGAGAGASAGGDGGGEGSGGGGDTPKTYTKEEFDAHMGGLRRKYEGQLETTKAAQKALAEQLEQQKQLKGLSDDERTALQTKIDELESSFMTEKEKADRASAQQAEQFTNQINGLTQERDHWRSGYQTEVISNSIRAAAAEHKAYDRSGDQIAAIIRPMVEFKEVVDDDGQPTGSVKPIVKFPDIDSKTKEPITMEYTVAEAVKRMTELNKHFNLFEDTMRGGLGGSKNGGAPKGKVDVARLAREDPAALRKLRKEQPEVYYAALQGN